MGKAWPPKAHSRDSWTAPLSVLDLGRERQASRCLRAGWAQDTWPRASTWIKARSATGPRCPALPFPWTWEGGLGLCNKPSCQILLHHLQSHRPSLGPLGAEKKISKTQNAYLQKTYSIFGYKISPCFCCSGKVLPQTLQMQSGEKWQNGSRFWRKKAQRDIFH